MARPQTQMRSTGPAASISTSTLKHKPSSSSRMPDTPTTLVGQLSSHDLRGIYTSSEWAIRGRQSPQSIRGLKQQAAVRPETPPKKLPMESSSVANQKMTSSSPHLMASSFENQSQGGRRRTATPPVAYVTRQAGATSGPAVSATNALNLDIHVSRQSKPLPAIAPSPARPVFAEVLSASPSSMATSQLPVYSSDSSRSTSTRRRPNRTRQPGSRTPSFGSRRHGGMISQLYPEYSSSDSDSDSIARSHDSVSTGHTGSTDNRTSRYARLLDAIGI
ncbi:hypothetical protein FRC04_007604 [Tulasnella sp. 424]|nr:hypothetical protein FRC04_007604 [Tulasnella sp. 424]KAG8979036.1 hypothetical protein FRC05_009246 [Tulasnella sp. 425]